MTGLLSRPSVMKSDGQDRASFVSQKRQESCGGPQDKVAIDCRHRTGLLLLRETESCMASVDERTASSHAQQQVVGGLP